MGFKIAVKAFIVKKDKLLIVKRSLTESYFSGIWELPGGKLEPEEDPKIGVIREAKEETNLDIEIIAPLNVQHFERKNEEMITMIIFLAKTENEKIQLSEEHSNFEWVNLDSAKEKLVSFYHGEVDIYNKLFKQ